MAGDYSRNSFDSLRDFSGVFLQQGHPTLDADWNEWVSLVDRRMRAETVDTIGRATVPRETPAGFAITVTAGPKLSIGRGRIYVDGLLVECHGAIDPATPPVLDRERVVAGRSVGVLDEATSPASGDVIDYLNQPYWPTPDPLPAGSGPHLAYLDVWRREVTAIKDPKLLDPALGGIDTATRWQTVWQVRLLPDIGAGSTCGADIDAWDALVAPSPARLTTDTVEFDDPEEPCLIPPGGGYRGLENQFYRVEIHQGGALGGARFKWSRDNASVGSSVESFADASRLTVRRIGRDAILRFETGDWVEVTDDRREFAGKSGDMRRVTVEPDTNELRFDTPLSADLMPSGGNDTAAARHSRVVKWDQAGQVLLPDGTVWHDLDAPGSDGLIPVPADGRAVMIEAGITVSFTTIDAARPLRAMDHWSFGARTEGAGIERLNAAPPHGIHHHYARLGVVTFPSTVVDCRTLWPPIVEAGEECGCTVCVSAEAHNSGVLTIQQAINSLPAAGGTVCLGPGDFQLGDTPVLISGRHGTRLKGHGGATVLTYTGSKAAIGIVEALDARVSDLAVAAVASGKNDATAVYLFSSVGCAIERVGAAAIPDDGIGRAIVLEGFLYDVAIEDCTLVGHVGVGARDPLPGKSGALVTYALLAEVRIARSSIAAADTGILLNETTFHFGQVTIERNLIFGAKAGIVAKGTEFFIVETPVGSPAGGEAEPTALPKWTAAALRIEANGISVARSGDGIISAYADTRISDNEIVSSESHNAEDPGSGITLITGVMSKMRADVQITGNRIGHFDEFGIRVEASVATIIAKRNVIRDCGMGGFVMTDAASAGMVSFDNNHIERVGKIDTGYPQAAIRLVGVADARIIGNHIEGVGPSKASKSGDSHYWAGIDLDGVLTADIAHNVITGIGPRPFDGTSYGIYVRGALGSASIASNHIFDLRAIDQTDRSHWAGIFIRSLSDKNDGVPIVAQGKDANRYIEYKGKLLGFSSSMGVKDFGEIGEKLVVATDNRIEDTLMRSKLPLVGIVQTSADSSIRFSGNQCRLFTPGSGIALVQLGAFRVDASHNMVRHQNDSLAMQIKCGMVPRGPAAIVIGNITTGGIEINGASLLPPFDMLNIHA